MSYPAPCILDDVVRKILAVKQFTPIIYLVTEDRNALFDIINYGACFDVLQKVEDEEIIHCSYTKETVNCNVYDFSDYVVHKSGLESFLKNKSVFSKLPAYFYIQDFHVNDAFNQMEYVRKFVAFSEGLKEWPIKKNLILTAPYKCIPPGFESYIEVIDIPIIGMREITEMIIKEQNRNLRIMKLPEITLEEYASEQDDYITGFKGLNRQQVKGVLYQTALTFGWVSQCGLPAKLREKYRYDDMKQETTRLINERKRQMVAKDGSITFEDIGQLAGRPGGMDGILQWIQSKKKILDNPKKAEECYELFPKGVLIAGLPGSGKSYLAKYIAQELSLPLIQFKLSAVLTSLVGGTEEKMDRVLKLIEAVSPCVVWIDEIEKELSGTQGRGDSDAGVASRCLARLLNWLQENKCPCFVYATANRIDLLPTELMRRGRFDRKYYTFLPLHNECVEIMIGHINKVQKNAPKLFDADLSRRFRELAEETFNIIAGMEGKFFTGADIEGLIQDTRSRLFDKNMPIPYGYNQFLDALVEIAQKMTPYGESHYKETLEYWYNLREHPFMNAAIPEDCTLEEQYKYMLFDFKDLQFNGQSNTWRKGLTCVSEKKYDQAMFQKLKKGLLEYEK